MSNTELYYLVLAFGLTISIATFLSTLRSPEAKSSNFYLSNTEHLDPKMVKLVGLLGGDMLSILPDKFKKKSVSNKEVDDVFKASGNPWEVTKMDFLALRVAYGFVGLLIGLLFCIIVRPDMLFAIPIICALTFIGWNKPISTYRKIAKTRTADFKRHFPEMLDYLTMIMRDGTFTFANAIEEVVPYLPESTVKREFEVVTDSINAGMSMDGALRDLSEKLPSPSLEAFVNAVINANELNTPLDDLMRTQAEKSREDLTNEIELIIQGLPTKTMLTVAPATIVSMLLIFMVPVVVALLSTL